MICIGHVILFKSLLALLNLIWSQTAVFYLFHPSLEIRYRDFIYHKNDHIALSMRPGYKLSKLIAWHLKGIWLYKCMRLCLITNEIRLERRRHHLYCKLNMTCGPASTLLTFHFKSKVTVLKCSCVYNRTSWKQTFGKIISCIDKKEM